MPETATLFQPKVLFDDQSKFLEELSSAIARYGQVIGCAATGYGKTVVFSEIAPRAQAKGLTVLVLTESTRIFTQIKAALPDTILINPKQKDLFIPQGKIFIAMSQTLNNRQEMIDQFKSFGKRLLMVIDEAHVGTFNKVIEQLPEALKAAFTATPDARWAKHLPVFYKHCIVGPQPEELIQKGRLCPYDHFARASADLDMLSISKGDFSEASQEKVFETAKVFDGLVDDLRTIPFKKCLIFTASVNDCELVYRQLNEVGLKCVRYHRTKKLLSEEAATLSLGQFMQGDINICVSVGTLTKGFDFPKIDLIVLRRATTSLPLYLQMCGRGSRTWNEKCSGWDSGADEIKRKFTVLDYGGNYIRHGLWYFDRDWKDLWNKPSKAKDGVAAIKVCPQCSYISPAGAGVCPNCGYEFVKKDLPLELGVLVEITDSYNKLKGKWMSQLNPEELAIYAKFKNKKNYVARIARARDQEKPESKFLEKYAEAMGYKMGWVDFQKRTIERDANGIEIKISYANFELR